MTLQRRAVFLDRDGVLNFDRSDHVKSPEEFVPIPGAAEAVARLKQVGWAVVVVSNQSGIGRGLFDQQALDAIVEKMHAILAAGGGVDGFYYCPHLPDADCDCRKPKPGLLLRAAKEQALKLEGSYMVGDKEADIECGRGAGLRTVLVETGRPGERPDPAVVRPDHVAKSLRDAVAWILQDGYPAKLSDRQPP